MEKEIIKEPKTIDEVIIFVTNKHGISPKEKNRRPETLKARWEAIIMLKNLKLPLKAIYSNVGLNSEPAVHRAYKSALKNIKK